MSRVRLAAAAALVVCVVAGGEPAAAMTPAGMSMDATMGPFARPIAGVAPDPRSATRRSVTSLRVTRPGRIRRFTLVARDGTITLAHGAAVAGELFDGRSPGPTLRLRRGDTAKVTLVNRMRSGGTAIHWHGIRLVASQDGVPGITQDLVPPGGRYTYTFTVPDAGTFWYHAHQDASRQVPKGLYGPLVVLPPGGIAERRDLVYSLHTYDRGGGGPSGGPIAVNGDLGVPARDIPPGTTVRLRVLNTDNGPRAIGLTGAAFTVVALDGNDLDGPTDLVDTQLPIAAAGRVDLTFTMPATPVALTIAALPDSARAVRTPPRARVVLGHGATPSVPHLATLDLLHYGAPVADPLSGPADVTYPMVIAPADGAVAYSINGATYPHVPTMLVAQGQLVRIAIVNEDDTIHPIHLHGHTFAVLADDGVVPSGSPLHLDTYQVRPGHRVLVAFRADNPGLWMLHCHNLAHAALGLDMMVDYVGITSPFRMGGAVGNQPE